MALQTIVVLLGYTHKYAAYQQYFNPVFIFARTIRDWNSLDMFSVKTHSRAFS